MRTILLACALSFVVTAAIGPSIIHWLRKMKFGQKILEDGPTWHMKKQNIPTMGGFMFMIGIAVSMLVMAVLTDFEEEGEDGEGRVMGRLQKKGVLLHGHKLKAAGLS